MKALRVKVSGRVQRVGYRRFVSDLADEIGILGYVRNERDHSVTVFAQGSEEALARFLEEMKKPPLGLVKSAVLEEVEPEPGLSFFEMQFGSVQEELTDGFGAMEQEFRDYRQEFRDYRKEFGDHRQEFKEYREEFRDYRQEFREFASRTDGNFLEMSEKYGAISEKLTQMMEAFRVESAETRKMLTEAIESLKRDSAYTREELKRSVDSLVTAVQQLVQATSKK